MRRAAAFGTVLWLAAGVAAAQDGPKWNLRTVDGRELHGALELDADGKVRLTGGDGATRELALGELLRLTQAAVTETGQQPSHRIWLRSGSDFPASSIAAVGWGDGSSWHVEPTFAPPVTLALRHLAAVRFLREGVELPTFDADRQSPAQTQDYLYVVREGKAQRFSVTIAGVDGPRLRFEMQGNPYNVNLDEVAAVVFGSATGFAPDRQTGPRATVALDSGDRVEGSLRSLGTGCVLRLDAGAELHIELARVRSIDIASDRLRWLPDLQAAVEQTPAFDRVWPWTADRSPFGGPIRLGGRSYDRGLVVVPRIRLRYDLQGAYDVFAATIGMEERAGPQANAIFRVHADGRVLFESEAMTPQSAPVELELPLDKARQLVLEVDFGRNYDLGDLCVFADARVLKR